MANMMASAAALAEKRAEGVTLGRPSVLPEAVVGRIVAARGAREGWSAIARALNADAVPTAHRGAQCTRRQCGPLRSGVAPSRQT